MLFDNDFLESIPNDPIGSIVKITETTLSYVGTQRYKWSREEYGALFEGLSLVLSVFDNFNLSATSANPKLEGEFATDCPRINTYLKSVQVEYTGKDSELRLQAMKGKFDNILNQAFVYEFSTGDINRVQELINELREQINSSPLFEKSHKERLLKRLERLQSELHKRMSDIDKFWGLIGDAGVVLGKFGDDAKPFVDRIREIADIIWRTQSRAEELPSDTPTPLLTDNDK